MDLAADFKISILISLLLINSCVAHEIEVFGKLPKNSTLLPEIHTVFVGRGREVKLLCDLGGKSDTLAVQPQWSFMQLGQIIYADIKPHCMENKEQNKAVTSNRNDTIDCEIEYDKDSPFFVLELNNLKESEFGDYICHLGNITKVNITFSVQEHVTLTRKTNEGKVERSVTLYDGYPFHLYCNETGLELAHVVSWWKDGENITDALDTGTGLFENFTKTDDLSFDGASVMKHRGNYTCQVDLGPNVTMLNPDLALNRDHYPVKFSFYVRVKENDRWKLPSAILLGEAVLIGLFTLFLNWREKRSEEIDGDFEDSDDEDEVDIKKEKNGVQKNDNGVNGK